MIYNHAAFDWNGTVSPLTGSTGLVYELHVGTFNNPSPKTRPVATFDDAIQRLDYLQQLGVEIIALMPVTEYETATSWGYNPAYLFAVENDYGGPDGLKRFVKAAHERGMKVQLDVVHNHYNSPEGGLLQFDGPGMGETGNGIYFYGDKMRGTTPWGPRPDFSQPEVRSYMEDNARHWLEKYHIDGFRWDAPRYLVGYNASDSHAAPDTLLPEAKSVMAAVNRMIHVNFPGCWSIAEEPNLLVAGTPLSWGQLYLDAAVTDPVESFDGHWQGEFCWAVTGAIANNSPTVSSLLGRVMNYSEPPATRVVFTDNHDQAGDLNGAKRLPHRLGEADPLGTLARRKSLLGAVLTLTAPGSPMLLMGQEFHATGAFSDRQSLNWALASRNYRLFRAYLDLVALRRDFATVRSTALSSSYGSNEQLRVGRYWRGSDVVIVFNNSSQRVDNASFTFPEAGDWFVRINTDSTVYNADFTNVGPAGNKVTVPSGKVASLNLAPYSAIVFTRAQPNAGSVYDDANSNGLPDSWETITGVSDPAGDEDGDGLTNLQEFESGLDPRTFNAGSVVGNFNAWDEMASPLAQALGNDGIQGHMQYFAEQSSGLFRWLLGGKFYGLGPAQNLIADGDPIAYQAPAGSYLYFSCGDTIEAAAIAAIDPDHPTDSDSDGMDDHWQTHFGLSDPAADADGDGLTNVAEFHRGSNPLVFDRTPTLVGNVSPLGWTPEAPQLLMSWSDKRRRWEWAGTLPAGALEFKFAMGPGWSGDNHGRSATSGRTDTAGGNILASLPKTGRYRFSFNELTKTYAIDESSIKAEWREEHDLASGVDWKADTDGDGVCDLNEYALGGDPRRSDAHGLGPQLRADDVVEPPGAGSGQWFYRWIENSDLEVSTKPEITDDFGAWSQTVAEDAVDQSSVPKGHVRKQVPIPPGTERFFLRLRTSMP